MHNFRKKIKSIIYTISTILFLVFLFELYFRFTEIILPSFVYDNPELGRTHKASSLVNLVGAEGFYMGKINNFGYPGKEYPPAKKTNTFRIALIGDSYVEGFQLFERHHFARLLEKELNKTSDKKFEILNFGTGGADFRGMYLRYTKLAKKFNPDLTLFFIKNEDLLQKDAIPMPEPIIVNDSIVYNKLLVNNSVSKLRNQFAIVRNYSVGNLFKEVFEVIFTGRFPAVFFEKIYFLIVTSAIGNDNFSAKGDQFYDFNKKIIELLSFENDSENKSIIVEVEKLPENYDNLFKANNIKTLKLFEELNKYSDHELKYWKASGKFGHWNQKAHLMIENFLFYQLKNEL